VHEARGHGAHVSSPALAVTPEGPLVAWTAPDGHDNVAYVARPGTERVPTRVSPPGMSVDSLHQAPGVAVGPGGEVYVTWSSRKPKPAGGLFASDLQLSRSLDGGRSFEPPLRVNDDRPVAHSFEGVTVAPDGTVLVAWIDARDGARPSTYLARVTERGARVESVARLEDGETCVCCRVAVAAGPAGAVAVAWRRVFPGDVRDMVATLSADGGRTAPPAARIHADHWRISACPHRGGSIAVDARGRLHAAWYTEGAHGRPAVMAAVAADGRRFGAARRLPTSAGWIPDQVRLAVHPAGHGVVVWEESTAVRRRVMLQAIDDGGRPQGAPRALSQAIKAYAPDVAVAGDGLVVAWHEEQFPVTKTVVQPLRLEGGR
jgi:hypothetical protein